MIKIFSIILLLANLAFLSSGEKIFRNNMCYEAYLYHFLNRSCSYGDEVGIRILLDQGADPNGKGYKNYANCVAPFEFSSPLYVAVTANHIGVVKILLHAGADPNILEGEGVTPLISAVEDGNVELVKLLLKYGAKTEIKGMVNKPLDIAKQKGFQEILKLLEGNKNVL